MRKTESVDLREHNFATLYQASVALISIVLLVFRFVRTTVVGLD
jgi:hypothetical protein